MNNNQNYFVKRGAQRKKKSALYIRVVRKALFATLMFLY